MPQITGTSLNAPVTTDCQASPTQSVGRTGVCFDNATSESLWSTLKPEFDDRRKWTDHDEAPTAVARWIKLALFFAPL